MPCGGTTGLLLIWIYMMKAGILAACLLLSGQALAGDEVLKSLLVDDFEEFMKGSDKYAMQWKKQYDPKATYSVTQVIDAYIENEVNAKMLFEPHFNLTGDVLRVGVNKYGSAYAQFLTKLENIYFYAYAEDARALANYKIGSKFDMVCADFQKLGDHDLAVNCFERQQFIQNSIRMTFDRPDLEYFAKYSPSPEYWQKMRQFAQKIEQSPIREDFLACMSKDDDCHSLIEQIK
jgi:hypothetical protein